MNDSEEAGAGGKKFPFQWDPEGESRGQKTNGVHVSLMSSGAVVLRRLSDFDLLS
jgi:hypothetical protein